MNFNDPIYIYFVIAGFFAGIINTLAGNGSVFTLSILIFSGMPLGIANGTNRLGAMIQCLISIFTFKNTARFKSLSKDCIWFIPPSLLGSIFGANSAIKLSDEMLTTLIGYLMIFILILIIFKPRNWLINTEKRKKNKNLLNLIIFFGIGWYAGFIQMGMGILFLSALVLITKYCIIDANFIKIMICSAIILPALLIYVYHDQMNWKAGIALSLGQGIGGGIATKFAIENKHSIFWVRKIMIVMIIFALIKLYNLHLYFI